MADPKGFMKFAREVNAPKDCPAEPVNLIVIVFGGSPSSPYFFAMRLDIIVPTVRFTFRMGRLRSTGALRSSSDRLDARKALDHWKARGLDFSEVLYKPEVDASIATHCVETQDHGIAGVLDHTLIEHSRPALEERKPVSLEFSSGTNVEPFGGSTAILPPQMPLPR